MYVHIHIYTYVQRFGIRDLGLSLLLLVRNDRVERNIDIIAILGGMGYIYIHIYNTIYIYISAPNIAHIL